MNKKEQVLKFDPNCFAVDQLVELYVKDKQSIESKKKHVEALHREGYNATVIAELSGVPIRSVYRYISDCDNIGKELTVANYIKAVNNGYDTKNNLPTQFRVTKKTLLQFEKESGVLALLAKAEHIQGKSYEEIKTKLHLRERIIDSFNIHQLPTIQQIKNELSQILAIYEKMAEVDYSYVAKSSSIKSIIQKL